MEKKHGMRILKVVLSITALAVYVFLFRHQIEGVWLHYFPCRAPLSYSIGALDERFNLSIDDVREQLKAAESIWEEASGLDLFVYKKEGGIRVDFVYDERQGVTDTLSLIGKDVDESMATYLARKREYEDLRAAYIRNEKNYSVASGAFLQQLNAYNAEVTRLNRSRRVTDEQRAAVEEMRADVERERLRAESLRLVLNQSVASVNAKSEELNRYIKEHNLTVAQYNAVGEGFREFDEGVYQEDASGRSITVYQFDNKKVLRRLLAHEFGHALGIDHVADPEAIMYFRNEDDSEVLSAADTEALSVACRLKK